jgi:hypothetical protein
LSRFADNQVAKEPRRLCERSLQHYTKYSSSKEVGESVSVVVGEWQCQWQLRTAWHVSPPCKSQAGKVPKVRHDPITIIIVASLGPGREGRPHGCCRLRSKD